MPLLRRRKPLTVLVALLAGLAAVAGTCARGESSPAVPHEPGTAVISRIVDGDTLRVRVGGRTEAVRLIGIDTPESVKPGTPVECFAKEAAARLGELVPPGTQVRLERDVEARDRYGRLLAYVFRRHDDLFVNVALARDGFANVATYPPNVAYTSDFVAAVADARRAERGLWGACPARGRSPP
ncbi:MAG TPA: thermonuclease family protein [Acidimicrobiales bacterium]|nr:thermonuclease family protein [Acidimicrobiales bacterium]